MNEDSSVRRNLLEPSDTKRSGAVKVVGFLLP